MFKMKKFLLAIIILMCCNLGIANDGISQFVSSMDDQEYAAHWIVKHTKEKVNIDTARSISKNAFMSGISKNLNPKMILAMIKTESNFNKNARSPYGAVGVMQVVPKYHLAKLKGKNPTDIKTSIDVGTTILADCNNGNYNKMLSCYSGFSLKTVFKYKESIAKTEKEISNYINRARWMDSVQLASNTRV